MKTDSFELYKEQIDDILYKAIKEALQDIEESDYRSIIKDKIKKILLFVL